MISTYVSEGGGGGISVEKGGFGNLSIEAVFVLLTQLLVDNFCLYISFHFALSSFESTFGFACSRVHLSCLLSPLSVIAL